MMFSAFAIANNGDAHAKAYWSFLGAVVVLALAVSASFLVVYWALFSRLEALKAH